MLQSEAEEGRVESMVPLCDKGFKKSKGGETALEENKEMCRLLNILCMYQTRLRIPHRNTDCAETVEPL